MLYIFYNLENVIFLEVIARLLLWLDRDLTLLSVMRLWTAPGCNSMLLWAFTSLLYKQTIRRSTNQMFLNAFAIPHNLEI